MLWIKISFDVTMYCVTTQSWYQIHTPSMWLEDEEMSHFMCVSVCTVTLATMKCGYWAEKKSLQYYLSPPVRTGSQLNGITVSISHCPHHTRLSSAGMAACLPICGRLCVHVMKAPDPGDNGIQDLWQAKLAYIVAKIYFGDEWKGSVFTELMALVSGTL